MRKRWLSSLLSLLLITGIFADLSATTSIGLYTFTTRESNSTLVTAENPVFLLFVMMYGHDIWFAKYKLTYPEGLVLNETMMPSEVFPYGTTVSSYSYNDDHGWTVEFGDCPSGWFIAGAIRIECDPTMSGLIQFERFDYVHNTHPLIGPIYIACG